MKRSTIVTYTMYERACDDSLGWCPACKEFTREQTEPDAEGYDCPSCEGTAVLGAEQAMLTNAIQLGTP